MIPRIVKDVADIIDFVLANHSVGILVLTGEAEFPDTQELSDTIASLHSTEMTERVQGGEEVPTAQRILERVDKIQRTIARVGGWGVFVETFKRLRAERVENFRLLRDASKIQRGRPMRAFDYKAMKVAASHHVSVATMYRNKKAIIMEVAHEICFPDAIISVSEQNRREQTNMRE